MRDDGRKDVIMGTYLYCSTLDTEYIIFKSFEIFSKKKIKKKKFVMEIKESLNILL
jgi:hypothetical protein